VKPLIVLAAGPGWLAIDKPDGLSVHNDPGGRIDVLSIAKEMLAEDEQLRAACRWQTHSRLSPAHRLDRETSGVLILATDRDSASLIQTAFEKRPAGSVKRYRSIVRGEITTTMGSWSHPLTDKAEGRRNPAGNPKDSKSCVTHWRRRRHNRHLSEIEVDLLSGRQHQIRRHAALAGHFVAGDTRYGEPRHARIMERIYGVSRMLLHAEQIRLPIATSDGKTVLIEAMAPLPGEFDHVFKQNVDDQDPSALEK
jgi:RluA family pseudouridine synthase